MWAPAAVLNVNQMLAAGVLVSQSVPFWCSLTAKVILSRTLAAADCLCHWCLSQAALKSAALIVERLLDRERSSNGGKYPESIALVLWGTDNIKTYGESLAQVRWCSS